MKINKYPDGTSYVNVMKSKEPITFKVNTYEDLHHLEQFVDAYNNYYKKSPTITIPWLIDGQADRRFLQQESSGLKIVLKRLNSMNAHFKIFYPHNPEVVEAMLDNVEIINNRLFIQNVLNNIAGKKYDFDYSFLKDSLILISADAGGYKPLMKLVNKLDWKGETYSASKSRKYIDGKSVITQEIDRQDLGGKDILIVDDISVYGGTFKGLAKILRERNVGKLYLAVSHMTVRNLGEDPVTNYFDKVFVTNSKFDYYFYPKVIHGTRGDYNSGEEKPKNLEIIKMF